MSALPIELTHTHPMTRDEAVAEALARWGRDATIGWRPGASEPCSVGEETATGVRWWGEGRSWEEAFAEATRAAREQLQLLATRWRGAAARSA